MGLPYWYTDKRYLLWSWPRDSHLCYDDVSDLEEAIHRYPLTMEGVQEFTEKHVNTVKAGTSTRCIPVPDFKWDVVVKQSDSVEQQGIGFMHELIHAFYRCKGAGIGHIMESRRPMEALIEQEAERFYRTNRQFVDELLSRLKTRQ